MSFLDVEAGRLYYEVAGPAHAEAVVFLHGFSLDTRLWDGQWLPFAERYQVVRYDLRGFGRSSLPQATFSHADDLRALLSALKIQTAHIVGLSLGGGVALDFALAYPSAVRSLILVDATLGGYRWTKDWSEPGRTARERGLAAAKEAWLRDEVFAPALERPEAADRLRRMVADYSGWHWLNRSLERGSTPPAIERLSEIAAPTLAIVGERDVPDFHAIAALIVR
ncbi:MAG: alpha/beta fold hydrolase, partial [Anaerolineales bacterium]|nr:alpha/beta fold hydrolase [Anaerolineales bacterium]